MIFSRYHPILVAIVCDSNNLQCRLVKDMCVQVDAFNRVVKDMCIQVGASDESMRNCLHHNKNKKHVCGTRATVTCDWEMK